MDGAMSGTEREIKLLKRVEELEARNAELQQTNDQYLQLLENLNEVIYTLDHNATISYISPNISRLSGYEPHELIGRIFTDFVHPEDLADRMENFQRVLSGENLLTEYRFIDKANQAVWIRTHGRPIMQGGGFAGVQGMLTDISGHKDKEAALRQSEKKFRDLFDSFSDAIIISDADGRILEVNQGACELTGFTHEEFLGAFAKDFIAEEYAPKVTGRIKSIIEDGPLIFESAHRRKDGTVFPIEVNARRIEYDGKPCFFGAARDITERKCAETEKKELQAKFYQSQKLESIGRLAGGVAHDLNNLLSPIIAYGEMLYSAASDGSEQQRQLEHMTEAGKRARAMVRQLLAFSRQQVLEFKTIDLNDLVKNFEKLLSYTLRENITVEMDLAEDLPAMRGDAGQIEQVIMNLAINSQDAMPERGRLFIETAAVHLDEDYAMHKKGVTPGFYVRLTFSDTGEGIDPEAIDQIFEPFFTTKGKDKGTGLGLSTAYGIVKQHGGNIWAYSEQGLGTTFKVYFPATPDTPLQPLRHDPEAQQAQGPNESVTVLVAEDEAVVRELVVHMLEIQGYHVLSGESGGAALDALNQHEGPVDLLLTDVVMPDMSGKELHSQVSQSFPDIKTIYMSGYTENVIAYQGVLEPGVNFIQKPFTVEDLNGKIHEVLN